MTEKKEYIEISFEILKILKEKYNLQDQEAINYIEEYGLIELYEYCPDEVSSFSYSVLAKDIYESITAQKLLEVEEKIL